MLVCVLLNYYFLFKNGCFLIVGSQNFFAGDKTENLSKLEGCYPKGVFWFRKLAIVRAP